MQSVVDQLYSGCDFIDRLSKYSAPTEMLISKRRIDERLHRLLAFQPDQAALGCANDLELEFISNFQVCSTVGQFTYLSLTSHLPFTDLSLTSYLPLTDLSQPLSGLLLT